MSTYSANNTNFGIIIQARLGSTRLKNKMSLLFYKNKSLAEVIFENLNKLSSSYNIILATSDSKQDDFLENIATKLGINVFRGSENNVLERFIKTAEKFTIQNIIRVCADNPFLNLNGIQTLVKEHQKGEFDYSAFAFSDGTPTIKSHLGLFAEVVSLKALKNVETKTSEVVFTEHVTNFIYANPDQFKINLVQLPHSIQTRTDIRLTIDTENDFNTLKWLFNQVYPNLEDIELLFSKIDIEPEIKMNMQQEIARNGK